MEAVGGQPARFFTAVGTGSGRLALEDIYPGIQNYLDAEKRRRAIPQPSGNPFKWWSRQYWEAFYIIPLRTEGGISETELKQTSLGGLIEAREALAAIPGLAANGKMNPYVLIISDNNTKLSGRIDKDSFSM